MASCGRIWGSASPKLVEGGIQPADEVPQVRGSCPARDIEHQQMSGASARAFSLLVGDVVVTGQQVVDVELVECAEEASAIDSTDDFAAARRRLNQVMVASRGRGHFGGPFLYPPVSVAPSPGEP